MTEEVNGPGVTCSLYKGRLLSLQNLYVVPHYLNQQKHFPESIEPYCESVAAISHQ